MNRLDAIRQQVVREFPTAQVCEGANAQGVQGLYVDYDGNGSADYFINPEKSGTAAIEDVTGPVPCAFRGAGRFGDRSPSAQPSSAPPTGGRSGDASSRHH